jgi:molecular chaperone DnaJ
VNRQRQLQVRIPAGVRDGATIRVAGRGGPGREGGPAGDVLVRVHVAAHPRFGRRGDDITLDVPMTFAEVALGTTIEVPTPPVDVGGSASLQAPSPARCCGCAARVHRAADAARATVTCS